ncbi:MAG: tRNA (N(6)-L-threonylcarbamoyladenosine(37)-C(2))-methylthiotransferase [Candidatus Odinarchaeia archaeon]
MSTKNFFIKTFGCSLNISDAEYLSNKMIKIGFKLSSFDDADIIIVNTCGVKEHTENKIINYLRKLHKLDKIKIITGCLPKINLERIIEAIPSFNAIVTPSSYRIFEQVLNKILTGKDKIIVDIEATRELSCDFKLNEAIGIVPISYGCLGQCSYCCVKFARGSLRSFTIEEVYEYTKKLVESGCVELWFTSQDTAAYGLDKGFNLPLLLNKVVNIKGDFKIRIGMMNPNNALKILDELIKSYKNDKIYKFLHLPIQSGDNEILNLMNRGYKIKTVEDIVSKFKKEYPRLTLSTDIIVGFPGETEDQFNKTLELIKKLKPDIVNISRYGDRPNTPAAKFKNKLRGTVIKKRSRILTELIKEISLENNKKWLGWEGEVTVVKKAPKKGFMARNSSYKPVLLLEDDIQLAQSYKIKIVDIKPGYLIGIKLN